MVGSKSPYTHGHSERVTLFPDMNRGAAGVHCRAATLAQACCAAARHRQARRQQRHPRQARQAGRSRMGGHAHAFRAFGHSEAILSVSARLANSPRSPARIMSGWTAKAIPVASRETRSAWTPESSRPEISSTCSPQTGRIALRCRSRKLLRSWRRRSAPKSTRTALQLFVERSDASTRRWRPNERSDAIIGLPPRSGSGMRS
jgi:hypothetical protein